MENLSPQTTQPQTPGQTPGAPTPGQGPLDLSQHFLNLQRQERQLQVEKAKWKQEMERERQTLREHLEQEIRAQYERPQATQDQGQFDPNRFKEEILQILESKEKEKETHLQRQQAREDIKRQIKSMIEADPENYGLLSATDDYDFILNAMETRYDTDEVIPEMPSVLQASEASIEKVVDKYLQSPKVLKKIESMGYIKKDSQGSPLSVAQTSSILPQTLTNNFARPSTPPPASGQTEDERIQIALNRLRAAKMN